MLKVSNLSFSYGSKNPILQNISFEITKGKIVGLLGSNGTGKSTLLKCLSGILQNYTGEISYDSTNTRNLRSNQLSKTISFLPQLFDQTDINVYETILLGRHPYYNLIPTDHELTIVNNIITQFDLTHLKYKNLDVLSGGEKQKTLLASVFAQDTKIILMDEPTNHLDLANSHKVLNIIKDHINKKNLSALISFHDINLALKFTTDLLILKDHQIYYWGPTANITQEHLQELYQIDLKLLTIDNKKFVVPN